MKIIDRIRQYIDYKNITNSALEQICGLSSGYIGKQIKRNADMGESILLRILDNCPEISRDWLYFGEGEMIKPDNSLDNNITPLSDKKIVQYQIDQEVPLYDISAAAGCIMLFQDSNNLVPIDTIKIPNLAKCDGAIFARGDSMYPIIKSGDLILYKIMHGYETIIWGETYIVCYESYGDCYTVVKYVKKSTTKDDTLLLLSHNEHHQPFEIHISQVKSMALVRASVRYNNM